MERRREIDGQQLVPLAGREFEQRAHMLHAGVVDQDVHGPQLGRDALRQRCDGAAITQVQPVVAHGYAVGLGDLAHQRIRFGRCRPLAMQRNGRALAGQLACHGQADAAGRARDPGHAARVRA
jgi:hypothetical protein